MPKHPAKRKHSGRRGDPISVAPMTSDEAITLMFKIKLEDVKKILASRPGKKK